MGEEPHAVRSAPGRSEREARAYRGCRPEKQAPRRLQARGRVTAAPDSGTRGEAVPTGPSADERPRPSAPRRQHRPRRHPPERPRRLAAGSDPGRPSAPCSPAPTASRRICARTAATSATRTWSGSSASSSCRSISRWRRRAEMIAIAVRIRPHAACLVPGDGARSAPRRAASTSSAAPGTCARRSRP